MNRIFKPLTIRWFKQREILFSVGLLLLLNSCKDKPRYPIIPDEVQYRSEIIKEKVEAYFQLHPDTLKLKAAQFLLDNSRYRLHQTGKRVRIYSQAILSMPLNSGIQEDSLRKMQSQFSRVKDSMVFDITSLDSYRIIEHVNNVVDFYKQTAWHDQIPFSVFCEYLLPYNIGQENLSPWVSYFRDIYFAEHDSSLLKKKAEEAATNVHQWIYQRTLGFNVKWGQNALNLPALTPIVLDHLRVGSCQQLTTRSAAMMRAVGIPVAIDMTPSYLNMEVGHSWNAAVLNSMYSIPFDATTKEFGTYRNNTYKISKVYRQTFSPQKDSHFLLRGRCSFFDGFFNSPFYTDVTDQYTSTSELVIPVNRKTAKRTSFAYLALFSRNGWNPISWGKIQKGTAFFEKVGRGGIYLPLAIDAKGVEYIQPPFVLNDSGVVQYLKPDTTRRRILKLTRKFPLDSRKELYLKRSIGGVFQGANKPDFSDAVVLYKINENPGEQYNTVQLSKKNRFRFVRYLSPPASYGNIAEIEFYEDTSGTQKLTGKIIGTDGSWNDDPNTTKEAAFDGNPLTYVDTKQRDSSWIGLDFEIKTTVGKIRFMARNDLNSIQIGNEYELFYWDNKWISLGKKIATTNELYYENAPSNALFWLRNYIAGREERIFTYENEEQIWW